MPNEDNNFDGSLVLDYRKSRRHVRPKNRHCYSDFSTIYGECLIAWLIEVFCNKTASDISKLSSKWYLEMFELPRAAIIAKYHVQVMLLFADNGSSPEHFHFWKCFVPQTKTKYYPIRAWIWGHVMWGLTMSPLSDWSVSVTVNQAKTTYSHQYWTATIQQACSRLLVDAINACRKTHIALTSPNRSCD